MSIKNWLRGKREQEETPVKPISGSDMPPGDSEDLASQAEDTQPAPDNTSTQDGSSTAVPPSGSPPGGASDGTGKRGGALGGISLVDITRGMQHAATAANHLIAQQYMQALDPFFEHTSDGRLQPKVIEMVLDDNHHFDLPLVALTTPRGLMLEKMKVFLTVRTDAVEQLENAAPEGEEGVSRFLVSLSPPSTQKEGRDSGHVDIEMQFTVLEPPESVMRLIDEYTRRILPVPDTGE